MTPSGRALRRRQYEKGILVACSEVTLACSISTGDAWAHGGGGHGGGHGGYGHYGYGHYGFGYGPDSAMVTAWVLASAWVMATV